MDAETQEAAQVTDSNSGPLAGIRVLDLTTVVMGPSATQVLADLGADVIKVESPAGDSMRWLGPARHNSMGTMFLQGNRNKKGLCLNLKSEEGKAAIEALVREVDVVVSNIRPQGLQRLGLGYAALSELNPRIIFCSAVGYGSGGPEKGKAVYDDLMQAASGIAALFGAVDGTPRYAPINVSDRVVGLYVVIGILAALNHRDRTGLGQEIEVPMFETMAQFVLADHMGGETFIPSAGDMGYLRLLSRFRGPYPTSDGYLSAVVYTDAQWRRFAALIERPDLLDTDERFIDQESRTVHAESIGQFLASEFSSKTTEEWLRLLVSVDIPATNVNSIQDLLTDEHLNRVGMFQTSEHPTEGTIRTTRFPITFSRSTPEFRSHAPNLGEHNAEVLADLKVHFSSH